MPSEQAQKFIDWYKSREVDLTNLDFIGLRAESREGREVLAGSWVDPASTVLDHIHIHRGLLQDVDAKKLTMTLETFIQCFPEEERFISPLMTLRSYLSELYEVLSWNSNRPNPPNPDTAALFNEEPYRPTRFERLVRED